MAQRRDRGGGADRDPLGRARHRGAHGHRVPDGPVEEQVLAAEEPVEAELLDSTEPLEAPPLPAAGDAHEHGPML